MVIAIFPRFEPSIILTLSMLKPNDGNGNISIGEYTSSITSGSTLPVSGLIVLAYFDISDVIFVLIKQILFLC